MKDLLKYAIWAGLYAILIVPFIVANTMFFPYIVGKAFTFRILVEVLLGLWLVLCILSKEFRPKWSWLYGAAGLFVFVMLIADINAVAPFKAFWSNYERMEGWVTLIHLLAYLLVLGSMLRTEKMWRWFFRASVAMSLLMGAMAISDMLTTGTDRPAGPLGNPIYISHYFLFNFFFAIILIYRDVLFKSETWIDLKNIFKNWLLYAYLVPAIVSTYLVYKTSRGVLLGLIGGLFMTMIAIAIMEKRRLALRKVAIGGIVAIVILVGGFVAIRNTNFVKNNNTLSRLAEISWSNINGQARQLVWPMAIKGFEEKPLLGWGQDGFNYVFNKYYDPKMYAQEQWFDRAHNTTLDYLVAGGILGLLSYLGLFLSSLYLLWFRKNNLDISEKGLITGLLAGYYFQSIFVFDNLVSYLFFFVTLSYIHSRSVEDIEVALPVSTNKSKNIQGAVSNPVNSIPGFWSEFLGNEEYQTYIFIPAILILTAAGIYWVNVPAIQANNTLIAAMQSQGGAEQNLALFKGALSYKSLGDAEIREQLAAFVPRVLSATGVEQKTKLDFANFALDELNKQIERTPNDARYQYFAGSYLSNIGNPLKAIPYLEKAVELSPNKQTMIFELVRAELSSGDRAKALENAKKAYEMETDFTDAKYMYITMLLLNHQEGTADNLLAGATTTDDKINRAYLILASESYLAGSKAKAVDYVNKAIKINPAFKDDGDKIIKQIWDGTIKFN